MNHSKNYLGVSSNGGTPKSSILIGFSIIKHPFWGTQFLETPIFCFGLGRAKLTDTVKNMQEPLGQRGFLQIQVFSCQLPGKQPLSLMFSIKLKPQNPAKQLPKKWYFPMFSRLKQFQNSQRISSHRLFFL